MLIEIIFLQPSFSFSHVANPNQIDDFNVTCLSHSPEKTSGVDTGATFLAPAAESESN